MGSHVIFSLNYEILERQNNAPFLTEEMLNVSVKTYIFTPLMNVAVCYTCQKHLSHAYTFTM